MLQSLWEGMKQGLRTETESGLLFLLLLSSNKLHFFASNFFPPSLLSLSLPLPVIQLLLVVFSQNMIPSLSNCFLQSICTNTETHLPLLGQVFIHTLPCLITQLLKPFQITSRRAALPASPQTPSFFPFSVWL